MTTFVEVAGVIEGTRFRFHCPRCSKEHVWVAEQVMNMADASIADFCGGCGAGVRVLKPASSRTPSTQIAADARSGVRSTRELATTASAGRGRLHRL